MPSDSSKALNFDYLNPIDIVRNQNINKTYSKNAVSSFQREDESNLENLQDSTQFLPFASNTLHPIASSTILTQKSHERKYAENSSSKKLLSAQRTSNSTQLVEGQTLESESTKSSNLMTNSTNSSDKTTELSADLFAMCSKSEDANLEMIKTNLDDIRKLKHILTNLQSVVMNFLTFHRAKVNFLL